MNVTKALSRHLDAINAGQVTKTNVIGMRKLFNAAARREAGYDSREDVNGSQVNVLRDALATHEPRVAGELIDSGRKLLESRRWRKRFGERELAVIADLDGFRLVRFDWLDRFHATPVYRAVAKSGESFVFRNIPWQAVAYTREEGLLSGPTVERES